MKSLLFAVAALLLSSAAALKEGDCQVCLKVLGDIEAKLSSKKDLISTEKAIDDYCKKPPTDKESKLCYYLEPIKREISQPWKNGVPTALLCERLKKKSSEICSLRYSGGDTPKVDDITDFNKLRVPQLKTLLANKGLSCPDCLEKADFVKRLEELKGKGEL